MRRWYVDKRGHGLGLVEAFVDVIPSCEGGGPRYMITTTSNVVEHETIRHCCVG